MDTPRQDSRAARVVAWHNRHPLARRITAAQVQGIGYVAVPFFAPDDQASAAAPRPRQLAAAVIGQAQASAAAALAHEPAPAPEGSSLRERAAARAKQTAEAAAGAGDGADTALLESPQAAEGAAPTASAAAAAAPAVTAAAVAGAAGPVTQPSRLRAAFIEDFIAPISRRAAARFIARHGLAHEAPPADGPVREVAVAKASPGDAVVLLYTATAAIEDGTRRVRVLLAPGPAGAVLGPRLLDRRRMAMLGVTLVGLAAATTFALWPAPTPQAIAEPLPATVAAAPAASAAVALAPAPAPSAPRASPAPPPPAAVAAQAPAAVAATAPPVPAPAPTPPPPRRDLRPALDEATKAAARQAVADLRSASPPAPVHRLPVTPASTPAHAATAVPAAGQPLFALTSRVLRTRAESEQLATAARALLAPPAGKVRPMQVELMPAGADWRVVAWPFTSTADAERARALLASRGLRVQVVGF